MQGRAEFGGAGSYNFPCCARSGDKLSISRLGFLQKGNYMLKNTRRARLRAETRTCSTDSPSRSKSHVLAISHRRTILKKRWLDDGLRARAIQSTRRVLLPFWDFIVQSILTPFFLIKYLYSSSTLEGGAFSCLTGCPLGAGQYVA